ncbi:MAG: type II toxin-antitoxin system RelE/ParE family toxin [Rhodospirillales bacterium]
MKYRIVLLPEAKRDIVGIHQYVALHDSPAKADRLVDELENACLSLAHFPERNNVPKELLPVSRTMYREAHWGPYRIVYRLTRRVAWVHGVFDGRRDMQTLLRQRLIL